MHAGLFEGFLAGVPLQLLIAALITGTPGAIAGGLVAAIYGASSANTKSA